MWARSEQDYTTPSEAFALRNDVSSVRNVGPKTCELLKGLGVRTVTDLLCHFPKGIVDRQSGVLDRELVGTIVTCEASVEKVKEAFGVRSPHIVHCRDSRNTRFTLTFFLSGKAKFVWTKLKKSLNVNSTICVSGKLSSSKFTGALEFVNPDVYETMSQQLLGAEAKYALTVGLTAKKVRKMMEAALEHAEVNSFWGSDKQQDWLPASFRLEKGWPTLAEAFAQAHAPETAEDLAINSRWRERLAFDEFVALQLRQMETSAAKEAGLQKKLRKILGEEGAKQAYIVRGNGILTSKLNNSLPFNMTKCQQFAVDEILTQLGQPERMVRCVQGDVGSGKTLVAIMAMLCAVEGGRQAALLAPTEILANQHFNVISNHCENIRKQLSQEQGDAVILHPNVRIITGSVKGKAREALLQELKDGSVDILVGTHALLTDNVADSLQTLGLVVIDEEQRFGVNQRDKLGDRSNVLFTTATPIPRSLMLLAEAANGYAISTLIEKPPAKREVVTILRGRSQIEQIIERISVNLVNDTKCFWVCPSLEENGSGSSAEERYAQLSARFPGNVALLHGRLSPDEKEAAMAAFARGAVQILVTTTVVEVGVDIPDASICVIDKAENFGLSQIHQIRGRIGRGEKPPRETLQKCFCVLLYQDENQGKEEGEEEGAISSTPKSPKAKLEILEKSNDGFSIAESDLQLRGAGDIFGERQHGTADYRAASITDHSHLLSDSLAMAIKVRNGGLDYPQSLLSMFTTKPPAEQSSSLLLKSIEPLTTPLRPAIRMLDGNAAVFLSTPILDLTKTDNVVLVLDIETTGLHIKNNRITQIACKGLGMFGSYAFNSYILPVGDRVSSENARITGITQSFLETEGTSFTACFEAFTVFIKEIRSAHPTAKISLLAHNGRRFDFAFIGNEFQRYYGTTSKDWREAAGVDVLLDTLEVLKANDCWTDHPKPRAFSMQVLFKALFGMEIEGAHNAVNDVLALERILNVVPGWRGVGNFMQFL